MKVGESLEKFVEVWEKFRKFGEICESFLETVRVGTFLVFSRKFPKKCASGYVLDAATSSGILKAKQKLGRTFNSDKLGGIAFTKISKLTMCSA